MFQAKPGSAESDESDVLALLIKDYEDKHYIIGAPIPIEAIKVVKLCKSSDCKSSTAAILS